MYNNSLYRLTDFIYKNYSWHKYCKMIFDEKKVLEDSKNTSDKVMSLVLSNSYFINFLKNFRSSAR